MKEKIILKFDFKSYFKISVGLLLFILLRNMKKKLLLKVKNFFELKNLSI